MDPVTMMTLATQAIGMGMQLFGSHNAAQASNDINSDQQEILMQEMQQNTLRNQAMNFAANRQKTEDIRNTQKAVAMNRAVATSSGAQFGSGVAGGVAGAAAAGAFSQRGVDVNQAIGNQIYQGDQNIGNIKLAMGQSMTDLNNAQGMMGMGQGIFQGANAFGRVGSSMFGKFGFGFGFGSNDQKGSDQ